MVPDVAEIWRGLERWAADHPAAAQPGGWAAWRPPAEEGLLVALEQRLASPLPSDYLESLRVHDGGGQLHHCDYLDVDWALAYHANLLAGGSQAYPPACDDRGEIFRPIWWQPKWLPIARHIAGTCMLLDLDPGPCGTFGQVLQLETTDGEGPYRVATSFSGWLATFLEELRSGKYAVDGDGNLDRIAD